MRNRGVDPSGLTGSTETLASHPSGSSEEKTQSRNERELIYHAVNFSQ